MPRKALGLAALALLITACGKAQPDTPNQVAPVAPLPDVPEPTPEPAPVEPAPAEPTPAPTTLSQTEVEGQYAPGFNRCLQTGDAARGVTPAMAACVQAELKSQDDRLNAAYRAAMARRGPAEQARLRTEERAWIRQRDADCDAQATGGTIDRVEIPMCLLNETIRRRVVLQPMAG
jgi:uncharacterized protein YecT (DUF1311 family)